MNTVSNRLILATAFVALSAGFHSAQAAGAKLNVPAAQPAFITVADAVTEAVMPAPMNPVSLTGSVALNTIANPVETFDGAKVVNINGDNVGAVRKVVLNAAGQVEAFQVEAGGFLGMGETVLTVNAEHFVYLPTEKQLVTRLTKDDVKALAGHAKTVIQPSDVPGSVYVGQAMLSSSDYATVTAQTLSGDKIGPVKLAILSTSGKPVAFDIDVGGFLGLGEKIVRVDADHFVYVKNGNALVTRLDKGQLKDLADQRGEPVRNIELAGAVLATTVSDAGKTFDKLPVEETDGSKIGNVEAVFVTPDGNAAAIQIEIGGFLGMGEHHVRVGARNFVFMPDRNVLITGLTKEDLTSLPTVSEVAADGINVTASSVSDPVTTFEQTKVKNGDDQEIGEVRRVVLDGNGMAASFEVNVGGFLGLGDHFVSLPADKLVYKTDDKILLTTMTKDEVAALPEIVPTDK